MSYAVMQSGPTPPSEEQLQSAFQEVPGLAAADAGILGRDAYGVLLNGLELVQASALQSALARHGIETEAVDEAALTDLPVPRQLTKVSFTPEALEIYDVMGRTFPLEWGQIAIIAAGRVWLTDFISELVRKEMMRVGGRHGDYAPTVKVEKVTTEARNQHLLLEIITHGAAARYQVKADLPETLLLYQCLGERRSKDPVVNLCLFVQEMARYAPQAALNYGAYKLCESGDAAFTYASKTAFYREITWLSWRRPPE
ncbi:MAG TPA: hypothetical protein VGN61_09820 [Verrucomicrobiae bacterium]